jgi:hypothetical protein
MMVMNVVEVWSSPVVELNKGQPTETRRVSCFRFSDFISAV